MSPPRPRVLVVDDDQETRSAIVDVLRWAGCEVSQAGDARAALGQASSAADAGAFPDVVLLDLILPDAAGFDVLKELRALPGGARARVVAMSGFPERQEDAIAGGERFDTYLRKPFGEAELLAAIGAAPPARPPRT